MTQKISLARTSLCAAFIAYLSISSLVASHIIGGDITYEFLSFNADRTEVNYRVQLVLYRDPTGVRLDNVANFGVYTQQDDGSWQTYQVVTQVQRDVILEHDPLGDPCKTRYLSGEKLEYTNYTFDLTLEITDRKYKIAYQKCCRNFTINNIFAEGNLGAVYDVIITPEAMQLGNSSPKFGPIPPLFVCSGYDLNIDHSAVDKDGDQLVYKFCTPLHPGFDDGSSDNVNCCGCTNPDPGMCIPDFPELQYEEGFSPQNPMRGDPVVTIDEVTGLITGRPELLGPYVIVVCVEEYRDGQLIGVVRRDFELNSIVCSDYLRAEVEADSYYRDENIGKDVAYFESCGDTRFSINNLSRDELYIKDYAWEIYNANDELIYNRSGLSSRDITVDLPSAGAYYGYMILNDNVTCMDTAFLDFLIVPELNVDFTYEYNECQFSSVQFDNLTTSVSEVVSWYWDFGDGKTSILQNPSNIYLVEGSYLVQLTAIDAHGCSTVYEKEITYELVEEKYSSINQTICKGEYYEYQDIRLTEAGTYMYVFPSNQFCDSTVSLVLDVHQNSEYFYADTICAGDEYQFQSRLLTQGGMYQDTLVNMQGCDSIITLELYVGENLTRLELDSPIEREYGSEITLEPVVEGGELIYQQWSSEESVLGNVLELVFLVEKDSKLFFESINELYCFASDSISVRSNLNKGVYIPNIFSPNNDGDNDIFSIGFTESLKLIGMEIFDRWGNLIYNQSNTTKSLSTTYWDGSRQGAPAEVGVYVYQLEFEFVNGDRAKRSGTVQLIR